MKAVLMAIAPLATTLVSARAAEAEVKLPTSGEAGLRN
jgi:hypothetical protein